MLLNFHQPKIYVLLIPAILLSCTQGSNNKLSDEQKKEIRSAIQPVIEQVFDAAAHADTAKLFDAFSVDAQFTYLDITGEFYEPAVYKQMAGQWFGMITSEIIEKGTEKYNFINEYNVAWSCTGTLTATYKNGKQEMYKPFGMTILFRKMNNKWKGVFIQESSQQPVATDTTNHS
ncbi:MAG TPA: nuclear transport factor 2 family protein [Parafilimonas sp.]|nr:nuclear transport factor 2 family protein [Parafilimonas sp.]